jgi:hypothetical protein
VQYIAEEEPQSKVATEWISFTYQQSSLGSQNAICECRLLSGKVKDGSQAIRDAVEDESRQAVKFINEEKRSML